MDPPTYKHVHKHAHPYISLTDSYVSIENFQKDIQKDINSNYVGGCMNEGFMNRETFTFYFMCVSAIYLTFTKVYTP